MSDKNTLINHVWLNIGGVPVEVEVLGIQYDDLRYAQNPGVPPAERRHQAPTRAINDIFLDENSCRAALVDDLNRQIAELQSKVMSLGAGVSHD